VERKGGRFFIGTDPMSNLGPRPRGPRHALWPLIAIPETPCRLIRALAFVESTHRAADGYGSTVDPTALGPRAPRKWHRSSFMRGDAEAATPLWLLLSTQTRAGLAVSHAVRTHQYGLAIGRTRRPTTSTITTAASPARRLGAIAAIVSIRFPKANSRGR